MTYSIEKPRNINLEDTAVPNLFITDFMPDVPDGDYVKVYLFAYMCCRQGIALTHTELADRIGLSPAKVLAAWRYFEDRRIVKLFPQAPGDEGHFDVEFVDVKGMLYAGEQRGKTGEYEKNGVGALSDPSLAALFRKIAGICGSPSIDGSDAQLIITWIEENGATPEIIEFAYLFCRDERGETGVKYVGKVVREWAGKGLKTVKDVRDHRAKTDARSAVHKQLMEALGLKYSVITAAEEKKFNLWIDDYGYTPERLLELADKTAGVGNKLRYLGGIIRKERESEGKGTDADSGKKSSRSVMKERNDYYREAQRKNEEAAAARLEEVYGAVPAVKQTDGEIAMLNIELVKTLTSGMKDKQSAIKRLNKEIEDAVSRRKDLLTAAGFAQGYTDMQYGCLKCRDTGILENGASCDCYNELTAKK